MALVKAKGSKLEMFVRRYIHSLGYRYRLHASDLPGKPDMVFRSRKVAVFTHGCFWHRHQHCHLARLPKSRLDFWVPKLESNKLRDESNLCKLGESGWKVLVVWECEMANKESLRKRIADFMGAV